MSSKQCTKGRVVSIYLPNDLYLGWKATKCNLSRLAQCALRGKLKELADANPPPQDRR